MHVVFKKSDLILLHVRWVGRILTEGPPGPLSPFSHAHLLWARGHFKHREQRVRCALQGHKSTNVRKDRKSRHLPLHPPASSVEQETQECQDVVKFSPYG